MISTTHKGSWWYVGYGYKTGKFGVKAGLRGEYTDQNIHFMSANYTTIQNNFFDLGAFAHAFISDRHDTNAKSGI